MRIGRGWVWGERQDSFRVKGEDQMIGFRA
jgi:hypothetical protein